MVLWLYMDIPSAGCWSQRDHCIYSIGTFEVSNYISSSNLALGQVMTMSEFWLQKCQSSEEQTGC